jgi:hypothetical protein
MYENCHNYFAASFKIVTAGLLLIGFTAAAQTSGLLQLKQVRVVHGGPAQFTFNDYGSGATNYAVEFSPGLGSNNWQVVSNALITPQSDGSYSVQVNGAAGAEGFYRVRGLGGSNGGLVITFTTTAFQVVEGDTVNTTLVLSQPFYGWIYYTVSGTAGAGDYQMLSGSNFVNGTTVTLPVSLTDNNQVGQLRYLTLRLEAGPGYGLGLNPSTTITIGENDAAWKGSFLADNATLGFTLVIDELNGVYQARLQGDGSGFFPTNAVPASISLTANSFSSAATGIPVAASATLLNTPASLTLQLNAMNGVTNQSVSGTQIQGSGELIAQYAGQPQLNTTNFGTFLLLKPPVAPSTNQVQLTAAP